MNKFLVVSQKAGTAKETEVPAQQEGRDFSRHSECMMLSGFHD